MPALTIGFRASAELTGEDYRDVVEPTLREALAAGGVRLMLVRSPTPASSLASSSRLAWTWTTYACLGDLFDSDGVLPGRLTAAMFLVAVLAATIPNAFTGHSGAAVLGVGVVRVLARPGAVSRGSRRWP
jgi:hypothetical protein